LECGLLTDLVLALCEGDSKENGMPILKVNALPLSRAHSIGTEPAALKEPSSSVDAFSSRRGDGCLSRYAIADAAAIAAPAVVNVKVSFGKFYLPNTSVLCREAVGITHKCHMETDCCFWKRHNSNSFMRVLCHNSLHGGSLEQLHPCSVCGCATVFLTSNIQYLLFPTSPTKLKLGLQKVGLY
jgi:hypothetical protein